MKYLMLVVLVFHMVFINLCLNAQVNTFAMDTLHPISCTSSQCTPMIDCCSETQLSLYSDSVLDFKLNTFSSVFGGKSELRLVSIDPALFLTGVALSRGELGQSQMKDTILHDFDYGILGDVDTSQVNYMSFMKLDIDTFYGWLSYKYKIDTFIAVVNTSGDTVIAGKIYDMVFLEKAWNSIPDTPLPAGNKCYSNFPLSQTVCEGEQLLLEASNAAIYEWSTGSTSPSLLYEAMEDTSFMLMLTDSLGCVESELISVKIREEPKADFDYQILNGWVYFENLSLNATDYTWDFEDGSSSIKAEPRFMIDNYGIYNICLQASNECYSDKTCKNITVTVDEKQIQLLKTFPNPASSTWHIQSEKNAVLEIYSLSGKEMLRRNIQSGTEQINVSQFAEGIYFYKISSENVELMKSGKLVKQ